LGSIIEARVLYKTVSDLPILPALSTQLKEEIVRRSIFGTAAIEGNPLTEEKVGEIISESNHARTMERAEQEIYNLKLAYDFVAGQETSGTSFSVTEEIVKQIHRVITSSIEHEHNEPGKYRNHVVKVGDSEHGGIYTPPKCLPDIKTLMKQYVLWINSEEVKKLNPTIRGALSHYYLALIHPFGDGNGRTARLVEALLLRLAGIKYVPIMLSNYYYRNVDDYFWAFSKARKNKNNDVTPFLEFALKGIIESLNQLKERITHFIRKFSLRDYYAHLRDVRDITHRQHDLLIMLLDHELGSFTLNDMYKVSPFNILYRKVSERTARRDLQKLSSKRLLVLSDDGKNMLNWRALDSLSVSLL
jgi:Fic family protein